MEIERVHFTDILDVEIATRTLHTGDLCDTEVIGETLYSLISPGTELMSVETAEEDEFPYHVGYASVDELVAVGSEVPELEVGDRVFHTGRHESAHRLDVAETPIVPVPDGLDPIDAPFARLCGASMPSLQTATKRPPALVGVFGLGVVGNLACQLSQVFGYDVVGVDPVAGRRAVADRCGVETLLGPGDLTGEALERETGRNTFEMVLEASGTAEAMIDGITLAGTEAEIVQLGVPWTETDPDVSAHQILNPLFRKYLTLRSGWEWQIPRFATEHDRFSHWRNYAHAMELTRDDVLTVRDLRTHVVTPEEVESAYRGLQNDKDEYLGVIIDWS